LLVDKSFNFDLLYQNDITAFEEVKKFFASTKNNGESIVYTSFDIELINDTTKFFATLLRNLQYDNSLINKLTCYKYIVLDILKIKILILKLKAYITYQKNILMNIKMKF
jgi:hypothetical protein